MTCGVAEEIAHTGGAFAFPGGERVGNATDVGREFVTVTSDEVDTDSLCDEDMTNFGGREAEEGFMFGHIASPCFVPRMPRRSLNQ